jgi:hypothetical protein
MQRAKPFWLACSAIAGLVLELILNHFYGGIVVFWTLILLFAFLIGLSIWNKNKKSPINQIEMAIT